MAELEQTVKRSEAPGWVWWCMCAGPLAWAADLGFSYVLAQHACSTGHHYVLHVITAVCFVIALTGFAAGWTEYKKLPREVEDKGPRPLDRAYFQILFGIVFSLAFSVVIIAGAVPRWILSACD
ncbi:MAG TPA: hypothetical protein VFI95_25100 [Terriglobales bacterium]|nr:hypothetical protein [Terriglobales bacterium]